MHAARALCVHATAADMWHPISASTADISDISPGLSVPVISKAVCSVKTYRGLTSLPIKLNQLKKAGQVEVKNGYTNLLDVMDDAFINNFVSQLVCHVEYWQTCN
nr:hypothetical protein Iba_chr02cCG6300 [Ipomoea batatas]